MKEIRFHGRGGQGVVKGAQILVKTVVEEEGYAHFIPFFGVERKGSPVYGFARIDNKPIRLKTQVYQPHCLIITDDTLLETVPVFSGLREDNVVIINTNKTKDELNLPSSVKRLAIVDATGIAIKIIGKEIPNTTMLGAFVKATGWVDFNILTEKIFESFGKKNQDAAMEGFENTQIYTYKGGKWNEQ